MKFFIVSWNWRNRSYSEQVGIFTSSDIDEIQLEYFLENSGVSKFVTVNNDVVPNYVIERKKLKDAFQYKVSRYIYLTSEDNEALSEMLVNCTGGIKIIKYDLNNKEVFV